MTANHDDQALDELLARSYASLRAAPAHERSTILDRLADAPRADRALPAILPQRPLAWLATAAGLVIAAAAVALLVPSGARLVYGVEAVPDRLAEVHSIRQRGYWIIYPREDAHGPSVRVPIENLVKRPDKFRHTWYGRVHESGGMSMTGGQAWVARRSKVAMHAIASVSERNVKWCANQTRSTRSRARVFSTSRGRVRAWSFSAKC